MQTKNTARIKTDGGGSSPSPINGIDCTAVQPMIKLTRALDKVTLEWTHNFPNLGAK